MKITKRIFHLIKFQLTLIQIKSVPKVQIRNNGAPNKKEVTFKVKTCYLKIKRELMNNCYCR